MAYDNILIIELRMNKNKTLHTTTYLLKNFFIYWFWNTWHKRIYSSLYDLEWQTEVKKVKQQYPCMDQGFQESTK